MRDLRQFGSSSGIIHGKKQERPRYVRCDKKEWESTTIAVFLENAVLLVDWKDEGWWMGL